MEVSKKLAEFIVNTSYSDFQPEVIHAFKRALLDYLCVTIAGSQTEISKSVYSYLKTIDQSEQSCVIGTPLRLSPLNAAFVNGTSCHALDFDDGYTKGSVHPAASCFSAVFAAAEQRNTTPHDFLRAVVFAYDVTLRISGQVHPFAARRGFHNTASVGVFGAAAGVSSLLGLNVEQTINALGASGSFAGGLREFLSEGDEGGEIKRIHPGKAARDGLMCAELAYRGVTAPTTILEGENGFFYAFAGIKLVPEKFFAGLGEVFEITNCYFKPYPVCRHLHGTIEAIKAIKSDTQVKPGEIEKLKVESYAVGVHSHDYPHCDTLIGAQMNHPCVAALAAFYDDVTLQNLQFGFTPEVKQLLAKIDVAVSEECEQIYPDQRPTIVTIKNKNGTILKKKILDLKGEVRNPLSDDELNDKFYSNCEPIVGKQKCKRLVESVWKFEQIKNLNEFISW
jgi:2-methylcitrate dehydratase PrpD